MMDKPIPKPSPELIVQCDAENQFSNFERVFRSVMSVPKAEVLKREAKEMHRNARKRARKKKKG
jgi:hypothetical protein